MAAITNTRLRTAIAIPALIYIACFLTCFSTIFKSYKEITSLAILADLLITAPLAYWFVIRKTSISKTTILRVFMVGMLVAGLLLSKTNSPVFGFIKTWISPLIEATLISFIVWKCYQAKKSSRKEELFSFDFLAHCRTILKTVLGNEKAATIMAAEFSIFYYTFAKKEKHPVGITEFTSHKRSGIILILSTFLCLFVIETTGMHFVFLLWNKTAAWILTALSCYSCLQLFAHTRALKIRTTFISDQHLFIRNGILGAEAMIAINNIKSVAMISVAERGKDILPMGLFSKLEKNNVIIHLKEPVTVIKAFGTRKEGKSLSLSIDNCEKFLTLIEKRKQCI